MEAWERTRTTSSGGLRFLCPRSKSLVPLFPPCYPPSTSAQIRERGGRIARSIAFHEGSRPNAQGREFGVYPWITCPGAVSRLVPGWLRQGLYLVGPGALGTSGCNVGELCKLWPCECRFGRHHHGLRPPVGSAAGGGSGSAWALRGDPGRPLGRDIEAPVLPVPPPGRRGGEVLRRLSMPGQGL